MIDSLFRALHADATRSDFSGVIRVDGPDGDSLTRAYGFADRGRGIPMNVNHRLWLASVAKGFTALAVGALIDDGALTLSSRARAFLGDDLPMIDDDVTLGHLMSHTGGIGDYLDEDAGDITDYVLVRPVHELDSTEAFLPVLDGHPQVTAPGSRFGYCNSGFVVLALIAERVSKMAFHDLVERRVFAPAGMNASAYPRTDEIPGDMAHGYLDTSSDRTNVLHLPVRGSGDGGAASTAADLAAFWRAMFDFRIVSEKTLSALIEPLNCDEDEQMRYGRGFWLGLNSSTVILEGYDAGVSARTWHDPDSGITGTVVANTSEGAWPVLQAIEWH
ncbi:MAG: serine hydrolase domain-containing protein [Micrococcaceae bacterium]